MADYKEISAGGQARQHNGDNYNYQTTYYPPRQQRSDDKLREQARNRALLQAAAEGQTVRVNKLLRDGADVDFVDKYGWSALHHAAYSGFEDTARELLAAGADVNARSKHFGTPMALAALKGRVSVFDKLYNSRASPNIPCGHLGSVMHAACAGGNDTLIGALLEIGADMERKAKFNKSIIDLLLEPQDIGNYLNFDDALERAAEHQRESREDRDWDEGVIYLDYEGDIMLSEKDDASAINVAALFGNSDTLTFLLKYVVDSHSTINMDKMRDVLYFTSAYGPLKSLQAYLAYFDGLDILNDSGELAVRAAAYAGNDQCLQHLLVEGAPAHPKSQSGMTALLWAARNGHAKCIELLTESDHPDKDWANFESHEATPLMDAASRGDIKCVEILLRKGASVEPPHPGQNALHCAAEYGSVPIIDMLVKAGIDVNSRDNYGWTPLMSSLFVQEWGYGEVFKPRSWLIEKLIDLGADPEINKIADVLRDKGWERAIPWLTKK